MDEYTFCNYVVATKRRGRTISKYFAADNKAKVYAEFDKLVFSLDPMYYEAVYIFSRANWNGRQDQPLKTHHV